MSAAIELQRAGMPAGIELIPQLGIVGLVLLRLHADDATVVLDHERVRDVDAGGDVVERGADRFVIVRRDSFAETEIERQRERDAFQLLRLHRPDLVDDPRARIEL